MGEKSSDLIWFLASFTTLQRVMVAAIESIGEPGWSIPLVRYTVQVIERASRELVPPPIPEAQRLSRRLAEWIELLYAFLDARTDAERTAAWRNAMECATIVLMETDRLRGDR